MRARVGFLKAQPTLFRRKWPILGVLGQKPQKPQKWPKMAKNGHFGTPPKRGSKMAFLAGTCPYSRFNLRGGSKFDMSLIRGGGGGTPPGGVLGVPGTPQTPPFLTLPPTPPPYPLPPPPYPLPPPPLPPTPPPPHPHPTPMAVP